jgi:hypothetical protein
METVTFNETFIVDDDTVLDIDTSHADIEFKTWDKDLVAIETIIEIEGATKEESERYFENGGIEVMGNSKKVSITTGIENTWFFKHSTGGLNQDDFIIDFDAAHFRFDHDELSEFPALIEFPELQELPELPEMLVPQFDYDAFTKDEDAYLKEWQKKFKEGLGDDYSAKMEKWAKKMEAKQEERQKRLEELNEKRAERNRKRGEKLKEYHDRRAELVQKRGEKLNERLKNREDSRARVKVFMDSKEDHTKPSVFFFSDDGKNRNFKVKKTIKIKMPKGMKIEMDVRHGEVKLAENTKNMNAKLSHSSLWATTIDGDKTTIRASYSPINIQKWNFGELQANYSESVNLEEVMNLRLNATSSNVIIDRLLNKAFIKSDFGPLVIKSIANNFADLDISLQNGELDCKMPKSAFAIYMNGTSSTFKYPASFELEQTKNHNNTIYKGYFGNKNSKNSVVINSKYSEVKLQ